MPKDIAFATITFRKAQALAYVNFHEVLDTWKEDESVFARTEGEESSHLERCSEDFGVGSAA